MPVEKVRKKRLSKSERISYSEIEVQGLDSLEGQPDKLQSPHVSQESTSIDESLPPVVAHASSVLDESIVVCGSMDSADAWSVLSLEDFELDEYPSVPPATLRREAERNLKRMAATVLDEEGECHVQPIWGTTPAKLSFLGHGVTLYFILLCVLGFAFFLMFVVTLPNLVLFKQGSMAKDTLSWSYVLSELTVANLGSCPAQGCSSPDDFRDRCSTEECWSLVQDVAPWMGLCDGLAVLIYMAIGVVFRHVIIPRQSGGRNTSYHLINEYTVMVTHLPRYLHGEEATRYIWALTDDGAIARQRFRPGRGALALPWEVVCWRPGCPRLISVAVFRESIYGVGEDTCVWKAPLHDLGAWQKRSKPGVTSISIHEGRIYAVGAGQCVYAQPLKGMTKSTDWEQVSMGSVTAIALDGGMIYGVGLDSNVVAQPVDEMTLKTPWIKSYPGDTLWHCSCRHLSIKLGLRQPEPLGIASIAVEGGMLYAVGGNSSVYRQPLRTLRSDKKAWVEAFAGGAAHISIPKEIRHRSYEERLGNHFRQVLRHVETGSQEARILQRRKQNLFHIKSMYCRASTSIPQHEAEPSMRHAPSETFPKSSLVTADLKTEGPAMCAAPTVRACCQFSVFIESVTRSDLGLVLVDQPEALLVQEVVPGGFMHKWFRAAAAEPLLAGHRIIEVNDAIGSPELMREELRRAKSLRLKIDKAIREVVLVRDYNGAIPHFYQRGKLMQKISNVRLKLQNACKLGRDMEIKRLSQDLAKKLAEFEQLGLRLDACQQLTDECREVVLGFVTFSTQEEQQNILDAYAYSRHSLLRAFQSKTLRFSGVPIEVKPAPRESNLLWENLDCPPVKAMARRVTSFIFFFIVLWTCAVAIFHGQKQKRVGAAGPVGYRTWILSNAAGSDSPCLSLCNWVLFQSSSCDGSLGSSAQWSPVKLFDAVGDYAPPQWDDPPPHGAIDCAASPRRSPACAGADKEGTDWIGVQFAEDVEVRCTRVSQHMSHPVSPLRVFGCAELPAAANRSGWQPNKACTAMELARPDLIADPSSSSVLSGNLPVKTDSSCRLGDPSRFVSLEQAKATREEAVVRCFCFQRLADDPAIAIPPYDTEEKLICKEWVKDRAFVALRIGGGSIFVRLVNLVLELGSAYLAEREQHRSNTNSERSLFYKMFFSRLVNTGVLPLYVSIQVLGVGSGFLNFLSLGQGTHLELTREWYVEMGTTIVCFVIVDALASLLQGLTSWLLTRWFYLPWYRKDVLNPELLKRRYRLPEWAISMRLAQTMSLVCVIMMYSAGMPILYLVGMLYCFLAYWVDKAVLLRGASRPPAYSEVVVYSAAFMWYLGGLLHTVVGAWTFSNQNLMPSGWSTLRPWLGYLLRTDVRAYEATMERWGLTVTDEEQRDLYWEWIGARIFEFSRQGAWLLAVMLAAICVGVALALSYRALLKPIVDDVRLVARQTLRRCLLASSCVASVEAWIVRRSRGTITDPFRIHPPKLEALPRLQDAIVGMKAIGVATSYRMKENPRYSVAYAAIQHLHSSLRSDCFDVHAAAKRRSRATERSCFRRACAIL